ncbi:hypothetical protein C8R44DRAFT_741579 [Mycena epipterygia]|nr:hypothetical protein C8R44DRAFT_741579 [Mycena epipterygia]
MSLWLSALHDTLPRALVPPGLGALPILARRVCLLDKVYEHLLTLTHRANALADEPAAEELPPPAVFDVYPNAPQIQQRQIILRLKTVLGLADVAGVTSAQTFEAAHTRIGELRREIQRVQAGGAPTPVVRTVAPAAPRVLPRFVPRPPTPPPPSPPVLPYEDIVRAEEERNRSNLALAAAEKDAPLPPQVRTTGRAAPRRPPTGNKKPSAPAIIQTKRPLAANKHDPLYQPNVRIVTLTSTSTSEGAALGLEVSEEGLLLSTEGAHLWNVKCADLIRGKKGVRPRVGLHVRILGAPAMEGEGVNPWAAKEAGAVKDARIQRWRELVRTAPDCVPDSEAPRDLNGSDPPVVFALGLAKQKNVPGDTLPPITEAVGRIERLALEIRAFEISAQLLAAGGWKHFGDLYRSNQHFEDANKFATLK